MVDFTKMADMSNYPVHLAYVPLIICGLLLISLMIFRFIIEQKGWNKGISPIGEKWNCIYKDSFGRRCYTDSEKNTIWTWVYSPFIH